MATDEWTTGSLTLCKKEIPVRTGVLRVLDLHFYAENPRIYSILRAEEEEPSQDVILKRLAAMDHVKQLIQSIKANGGLTDPLIVRDCDYVVLEGNSRLAAYKILMNSDPIKWGKVKCTLLPKDIGDDLVFALLGEYHIIGKKDWAPYEQAGYLYRRNMMHKIDQATMAQEMGLSTKKVGGLIRVYSFMVEHKEDDVNRWSYYDEYLKHNAIKKARKEYPELDEVVVTKIRSGEIPRAVDIREKLTKIAVAEGKTLRDFASGSHPFEKCYDRAIARGADNTWYKRLNKFRDQLADPDLKTTFLDMEDEHRKKCLFELRKIHGIIEALIAKMQ